MLTTGTTAGHTRARVIALATSLILLHGCGGGGGSVAQDPVLEITGTAASGAAMANASVAITDTAGNSPCVQTVIVTTALGSYSCTLKAGKTAPFFIVVTDPTGNSAPLVSIATTTPLAGKPLLVNATPLTTAIVAQLNGGDALGVISNKALYVPATFAAAKANVIAQIQAMVSAIDPGLSNYDPFSTSITAATGNSKGNTADQVLDFIKVTKTADGALALSTISDPTPVAVATAAAPGVAIAAPTTSVSDLAQAAQAAVQAFSACYAQPVSQRVTLDANGNITAVSALCQSIVTSAEVPTGAPAFKSNGYTAAQTFYNYLTGSLMTGAKFSVPEVMAFYPKDANNPRDRAVLNIKYVDNAGNAGNHITVAQNFPGSATATRPSNWWITGNQWNYDLAIKTSVRRDQQFAPGVASRFQNGMNIFINDRSDAPHSGTYDSALVTGPGLPTTGLWYVRSAANGQFVISTVRAAAPQPTSGLTLVCASCSSFWMSRTAGISGTAAATLATNFTALNWAGASDGSYNGVNGTRPTKGSVYFFNLYNNGTLVAAEKRTLLSDLVAATQEVNMQWNDIGRKTTSALDPSNTTLNGEQTSMPIDWIQNPAAERINYLWISQTDGGYDNSTPILPGATSLTAVPFSSSGGSTTFTSLTNPRSYNVYPFSGYREIGFTYRMLDGSTKQAVYSYWP
jgi:hypothetical protein